jgi:predicted nucleic acid-binding protein
VKLLVDSDWIIDGIAGIPDAVRAIEQERAQGIAVSTAALGEVYEGAFILTDPTTALTDFRSFLAGFTVLDLTEPIAEAFARERAALRKQGNRIPDMDLLIAATTIVHGLVLMTRNERHFARIPGLRLYRPV